MKIKFIILALLAFITLTVSAQVPNLLTNGVYVYKFYGQFDTNFVPAGGNTANDVDALARDLLSVTNFAFYSGGGYALSGSKTYLADAGLIYNVSQYAGIVVGADWLRLDASGLKPQETANVVKGGLTLSFSFTNSLTRSIVWTPYGTSLVATPTKGTDNNGGIGLISAFGMGETLWSDGTWTFRLVEGFENRTGEGAFDRNYVTGNFAISYGF